MTTAVGGHDRMWIEIYCTRDELNSILDEEDSMDHAELLAQLREKRVAVDKEDT